MVRKPHLGVVYKVTIERLKRIPLYKVSQRRLKGRRGTMHIVPQYHPAGWLENGDTVVFIDTFKTRQGHNEIYVITSAGQAGWVALQVADVRNSMTLVRQEQ
jgi:hypothetical protein